MSMHNLIRLRQETGKIPPAVWVVIGQVPARLKDLPDCIHVQHGAFPPDWRAVHGLHVDVFDLTGSEYLFARTLDALEAAKPKAIGVACQQGVIGLSTEHESVMRRIWRHLGTSV